MPDLAIREVIVRLQCGPLTEEITLYPQSQRVRLQDFFANGEPGGPPLDATLAEFRAALREARRV